MTRHPCCDERRLKVLARSGSDNAIAFLDVLDRASPPGAPRQCTLLVRLLHPPGALAPANLRIRGGQRIAQVGIAWCAPASSLPSEAEPGLVDAVDDLAHTLVVRTTGSGDFSTYVLSIVAGQGTDDPPPGFDPVLSRIEFSFKVECPSDFDCASPAACPPAPRARPDIDYLARDYTGFRRLMLDRLSQRVPDWRERSAADVGVMLVEVLAYAADQLSYRQDAIATEAYLATARRRISVRRHARLVDYVLHEGCNARTFVHFDVAGHGVAVAKGTQLLTRTPGLPDVLDPADQSYADALSAGAQVFEVAHDATLDESLNAGALKFYTWGDVGCGLPRGATRATLRGHVEALKAGDFLLLREVCNPGSLQDADADLARRWVVRLTRVLLTQDPSGGLFEPSPSAGPLDITEIEWDAADALPFPLCLSVEAEPGRAISEPLGNMVLADHGRTLAHAEAEPLGGVPDASMQFVAQEPCRCCAEVDPAWVPPRFNPVLAEAPLTHALDIPTLLAAPHGDESAWCAASALLLADPRHASPAIAALEGTPRGAALPDRWTVQRDLLQSAGTATDFTVEVQDDGRARLRFGDDIHGKRPDAGTQFKVVYRIGNGSAGNVGAGAIAHIVAVAGGSLLRVSNPVPAAGGMEPEPIEAARRDAPQAFRVQERAITAADYAAATERRADVQRAAARFRWTGSWYTVFVTPDRYGGADVDAPFAGRVRRHLERFRGAGYDVVVRTPRYVPLDVALHVCVRPGYFRADVRQAVLRALSSEVLPDGSLGAFHPDRFSFGEPVYLSRVVAAAQAVEGVEAVWPERFQRLFDPIPTSLTTGTIEIGALEIAQLANDPNFRERGRLKVVAGGGK